LSNSLIKHKRNSLENMNVADGFVSKRIVKKESMGLFLFAYNPLLKL